MARSLHDVRFPGETDTYRSTRNALLAEEQSLRDKMEQVARRRRDLPLGGAVPEDYVFEEWMHGRIHRTKLSDLFAPNKSSLILYSFMYGPNDDEPCPLCTSFLDGANAYARHFTRRLNFAVIARSHIRRVAEWADHRGWNRMRVLSSAENTYNRDYGAETPGGVQLPALNVFVRTPQGIRHFYNAELLYVLSEGHPRHIDLLWPIWSYFDLTPEGRGEFLPKLDYSPEGDLEPREAAPFGPGESEAVWKDFSD